MVQIRSAAELDAASGFASTDRLLGVQNERVVQVPPDEMRAYLGETFASRAAFDAATLDDSVTTVTIIDGADVGTFEKKTTDQSGELLDGSEFTTSSVDTGANEFNVSSWPEVWTGDPLYAKTGNADVATGTIVYLSRDVTDYGAFQVHTTFADAMAGTNPVALTSTDNVTFDLHRDPSQRIGIIRGTDAKDGSAGAWMRKDRFGFVRPEAFITDFSAADNGQAVQEWINWGATSYSPSLGVYLSQNDGRGFAVNSSISINHRAKRQQGKITRNLHIKSTCAGFATHDLSGCRIADYDNLTVDGDGTTSPAMAYLLSRVHSESTAAASPGSYNMQTSNKITINGARTSGTFTKATLVSMSTDLLTCNDCYFSNNYRGRAGTTTTVLVGGTSAASDNHVGGVVSKYHDIITSADALDDIGTKTRVTFNDCDFRRVRTWTEVIAQANLSESAGVLTITFPSGEVAANDIQEDDPVHITAIQGGANFAEGEYSLVNISGDTAQLGVKGGGSTFDASSFTLPTSIRIDNATGPALVLGGHMERPTFKGAYLLAYDEAAAIIDLDDGDIDTPRFDFHTESGLSTNFWIRPHASTARKITAPEIRINGDLITTAHIYIDDAGGTLNGDVTLSRLQMSIARAQAGTSTYPDSKLFGGAIDQLHLPGFDIATPESDQINLGDTFASNPTGVLQDLETGKTTVYADVSAQTGTAYTLVSSDTDVTMNNAAANTVTVPTDAAGSIPLGAVINITQLGAGATTITFSAGVTADGVTAGSATISAQYGGVTLNKVAADTWIVSGEHGGVA